MQNPTLCLILLAGLTQPVFSQPEKSPSDEHLVITATRNPLPGRELGASVIVLQRNDIEAKGAQTLGELLRGLPGVTIRRSGGAGANSEILIRGDKGGHTLIMVDGVEFADVSSIEKNLDIGDLPLHDVERIEIVKGPHSVAYGASGLSGIVHIITRRPQAGVQSAVGVSLGSYETYGAHARVASQQGKFGVIASVSGLDTKGYSMTASRDDGEADGYQRKDGSLRLQYGSNQTYHADLLLKGAESRANIDAGGNDDDPNYTVNRQDFNLQLTQKLRPSDEFETRLATAVTQSDRKFLDDPDNFSPSHEETWQRARYRGERRSADLSQLIKLSEHQTLTASIQWLRDAAQIKTDAVYQGFEFSSELPEQHIEESSYALQHQWGFLDRFFGQWGLRTLNNSDFGKKTVGQAAFNVQLVPAATTLRVNLGRGFKTPSLYQLRAPIYGNEDLRPEYVRSEELGLEQTLGNVQLSLTGFQNRTENLIEFDGNESRYYNINRARIKGLESLIHWDISEAWNTEFQYTQISSLDEDSNQPLASRPEESWSGELTWKQGTFNWMGSMRGQTRSRAGLYVGGTEGFRVVDSALSWRKAGLSYSLKVGNVLNTWYQEVEGYNTPARNYTLSSEISF